MPSESNRDIQPELLVAGADMFNYYQRLSQSRIVLTFKGAMSQEVLVELGDLIRVPDQTPDVGASVVKKLFAIIVEMAQNVLHYSCERVYLPHIERDVGVGMIILQQTDDAYLIGCGNRMLTKRVSEVDERCAYVNTLNKDELREYYNAERKKARSDDSAGAGLGFIDISRRAGSPLIYSFYDLSEDESFFTLSVKLDKATTKKA